MANNDQINAISLGEPQRPDSFEESPNTREGEVQASRQRNLDRKRALALVGSAILQLPIWGTYILLPS